jgi:hypothetical protein
MVKPTKADDLIAQELDELIAKSPPYSATTLELGD